MIQVILLVLVLGFTSLEGCEHSYMEKVSHMNHFKVGHCNECQCGDAGYFLNSRDLMIIGPSPLPEKETQIIAHIYEQPCYCSCEYCKNHPEED
jgi:hypothetical protein